MFSFSWTGFLRNKKTKDSKKSRNSKKNSDDDDSTNGSISGSKMDLHEKVGNGNTDFMIDAEGFTVRPTQAQKEEDRFYSSSDSDIESEDEKEKKIYVKINPLKNGAQISASVDQLIASAGALTLAPSSQSVRSDGTFLPLATIDTYRFSRVDVSISPQTRRQFSTMALLNVRCLRLRMLSKRMKLICLIFFRGHRAMDQRAVVS